MTAKELLRRYSMQEHPENGVFIERHYEQNNGRAASGLIYYYVAPNEKTQFHVVDCDEYWCYATGSTLDIWVITPDGEIELRRLGISEGAEPTVLLRSGEVFASRHRDAVSDGTFLSCITVPRFQYEGFRIVDREEAVKLCPAAADFFD